MASAIVAALPYVLSAVVGVGSAVYSGERAKSAQTKSRRRQRAMWQATAYASPEERQSAMGKLGQARLASYQSLASELAGRGMGPESGAGGKRMAQIEAGYGKGYAHLLSEFAKPRYPYRPGTSQWSELGGGVAGSTAGAEILEQAMGMLMANKMMKGGGTTSPYAGMYSGGGNWYDPASTKWIYGGSPSGMGGW